jgi:hypothetical protein
MANPDLPQGHSPGHCDASNGSDARYKDQSRLEKVLTKGSLWKKQTLRNVEGRQELKRNEAPNHDHDTDKMARMFIRLSAQLDQRNYEIEKLRLSISSLENQKSQFDKLRQRELELHRAELERLQNAYDQFEKESDSLISELGEQNERLLNECRDQNGRSLL